MFEKLEKLQLEDNDVLLIRGSVTNQIFKQFQIELKKRGLNNILLINIGKNLDIKKLPEEQMNKSGWIRNDD